MKTIVETSSGLSKYLLADDVTIVATAENITVGDPAQFIIGDLNSTTVTVTDNVTNAPDDWFGNKYFFDGTTWTLSPDWVDPTLDEE
tara:strand:- start:4762 stop:5022 length:261 start_codon:yes stop_codon:yes gene_type:complete